MSTFVPAGGEEVMGLMKGLLTMACAMGAAAASAARPVNMASSAGLRLAAFGRSPDINSLRPILTDRCTFLTAFTSPGKSGIATLGADPGGLVTSSCCSDNVVKLV
jgi:hypothetical protein